MAVTDNHSATVPSPIPINHQTNANLIVAPPRGRGRPSQTAKTTSNVDIGSNLDNFDKLSSPTKILKEVAIPLRRVPGLNHSRAPSPTVSTASSALSQYREYSNDYETPETSAAATPAESSIHGRRINLLANHKNKTLTMRRATTQAPSLREKGKRKRTKEDDEAEDFMLAQSLQEAEYAAVETARVLAVPRGRERRSKILDSEDELDDNMDVSFDVEVESTTRGPTGLAGRGGSKRAKLSSGSFLPSRAARDSAKKSIANRASFVVLGTDDDDDESELSEYETDLEFEGRDFDIEEDEDDGDDDDVTETNVVGVPISSARRRRRRAPGSGYDLPNSRRAWSHGMSRVSPLIIQESETAAQVNQADQERTKLEKAHPEIKTLWEDLQDIPTITPSRARQPEAISRQLKSFQLEGLDWMCKQEQSKWAGGLLGDEMGMGKTIQAVSLVMSDYPAKDPTLVVVPPVALMQWQNEINEFVHPLLVLYIHLLTVAAIGTPMGSSKSSYITILIQRSKSLARKTSRTLM